MNRRHFFSKLAPWLTLAIIAILKPTRLSAASNLKLVDETLPQAKGVKFKHDATTSPIRKNHQATCANCKLWLKKDTDNNVVGGTSVAKCQTFPGLGYVKSTGWCLVWVKNTKIKT